MAYYATLRKPSHKQNHYKSREALNATPGSLSQQSVSSVSMFDLRGGTRRPVRPAPLPPNKSSSVKKHVKGPSRRTPAPATVTPIAEQPSGMHRQASVKFLRMRTKLEARLTGCPTNSDDEEDEEQDDKHQPLHQQPSVTQLRSQTLPRKLKLSSGQPSTNPSKKPPVYLIKGPARQAPPPPKPTKKMVYRKLPLPSTHKPPPPIPTRHDSCHPAPSPPSTATIPSKRPAPPPPSSGSSHHLVSTMPPRFQAVAAQQFQQAQAVPVYTAETITNPTPAKLKDQGDMEALYSQVMAHVLRSKAVAGLKSFSPLPLHSYSQQAPTGAIPTLLLPPQATEQAEQADDMYEIPGYTQVSAASAMADTGGDDYTSMDAISSMQPWAYTYSVVGPKKNNPVQKQEGGSIPYSQLQPAVPHPPPLSSQQPPLGRVPLPPASTTSTEPDCHTSSGQIYDSIANN